jgi:nitrogen fixation protein FixH
VTKPKFNPWPWAIVGAFALFIPITAGLIILAVRQPDHLVRADYYEQEIRFQGQMESRLRAQRLGAQASIGYDQARRSIRIALPAEHVRTSVRGRIHLYRPSEAGLDRDYPLDLDPSGVQVLDAHALQPGLWKVKIAWTVGDVEFLLDERIVIRPGAA